MAIAAAPSTSPDLTSFLETYEREFPDDVIHVERPIQAEWEVSALAHKLEKAKRFPVLVCHNVIAGGQRLEMPLVTFLMASRARLAHLLGSDVPHAGIACYERNQRQLEPVVVARAEALVKEVVEREAELDVRRFPAPKHHKTDPGRYITAGFFLTHNRESGRDNSALHRGWLAGRDEVRVWLGPPTHNAHNLRQWEQAGEDMPAAFWIGHHPLVQLGAETHVGPEDSHFATAGGTLGSPLRLVPSETLGDDFLVPADAEVVIEGYVPRGKRAAEAPFGEYTRYVGPQRYGPVLKVTAVTHRRHAYWDDVMVGHTHWISSLPKEGELFRGVRLAVPGVKAVHMPMSGCGVVHAYVTIRKTVEGQGKTAGVAALTSGFGIKHAFVFDDDVDIFDEKEVMLALANRFQGDKDLLVMPGMTGSPLDPSSQDGYQTCKVVFDCTKPVGAPFAERLSIPDDVLSRIDPVDIIGRERFERIRVEPWG